MKFSQDRVVAPLGDLHPESDASLLAAPCHAGSECAASAARRRFVLTVALILWSVAAAGGALYGIWYQVTPTATIAAPSRWPAGSALPLSKECATLVMFVHPRCPCSRASLDELAKVMTHCRGRVESHVVFLKPPRVPDAWLKTDLWHSARRIPNVAARLDDSGSESRLFAARVSGETLLYWPHGALAFHGGITAGRGHAGDNTGRSAVESLLLDHAALAQSAPVFGCTLNADRSSFGKHEHPREKIRSD